MEEFIKDMKGMKQDFKDNNGTIRIVKAIISLFSKVLIETSMYMFFIPLLVINLMNSENINATLEDIFSVIVITIMVIVVFENVGKTFISRFEIEFTRVLNIVIYLIAIPMMGNLYLSGITQEQYLEVVIRMLVIGLIFLFIHTRVTVKDIRNIDSSTGHELYITRDDACEIKLKLGTTSTKYEMLVNFIKGITVYKYGRGLVGVNSYISDEHQEYYSMYESVQGAKDILFALGNQKISNEEVDTITVDIPNDFKKPLKYYYGVIKYLTDKDICLYKIKFTSFNKEELEKANIVLNVMKKKVESELYEQDLLSIYELVDK